MASSSSSAILIHSRKLLLFPTFFDQSPPAAATPPPGGHDPLEPSSGGSIFDRNVVMVLSVLLCALICSLGLNYVFKCAVRCSSFGPSDDENSYPSGGDGGGSAAASSRLANTGVKKKALKTFPVVNYAADLELLPGLDSECAICLSDFGHGERVRVLPKCNHGFHVGCIDRWLDSHSSCPTCRHCLLQTCHKIVGSPVPVSSAPTGPPPPPPQESTGSRIAPLQPEGLVLRSDRPDQEHLNV